MACIAPCTPPHTCQCLRLPSTMARAKLFARFPTYWTRSRPATIMIGRGEFTRALPPKNLRARFLDAQPTTVAVPCILIHLFSSSVLLLSDIGKDFLCLLPSAITCPYGHCAGTATLCASPPSQPLPLDLGRTNWPPLPLSLPFMPGILTST